VIPAAPESSLADVLIETMPVTNAPSTGFVIVSTGGVVSVVTPVPTVLETLTITGADVAEFPAASNATAVIVAAPFGTDVDAQAN
jgi:hypothetical protein